MKKGKKRSETIEITPMGSEVRIEPAHEEPGAAPPPAEDEAAVFDRSEETTPVSPLGSDGLPIPMSIAHEDEWDGPTTEGDARELAALLDASRDPDAPAAEIPPDVEITAEVTGEPRLGAEGDFSEALSEALSGAMQGGEVALEAEVTESGEVVGEGDDGAAATGAGDAEAPAVDSAARLDSIIESLLFASDRALAMSDLKRLLNQRDPKPISAAVDRLIEKHRDSGIQLGTAAGGWQFRTHPENAPWVSKLIAGRPTRLSRAMLETLAIVAYRQPITRPEIDEIRGVDCGPVLKTLLDRALIRMIGKKEEVGRPILYGTTPEFLRTFSLKDLTELPTLREFHELGVAERAKVDAEAPAPAGEGAAGATPAEGAAPGGGEAAAAPAFVPRAMPAPTELPDVDPDEEDALLAELDEATSAATRATKQPDPTAAPEPDAPPPPSTGNE